MTRRHAHLQEILSPESKVLYPMVFTFKKMECRVVRYDRCGGYRVMRLNKGEIAHLGCVEISAPYEKSKCWCYSRLREVAQLRVHDIGRGGVDHNTI